MNTEEIANKGSATLSRLTGVINTVSGSLTVHAVKEAVNFGSDVSDIRRLMVIPRNFDTAKWIAVTKTLLMLAPENDTSSGFANLRFTKGETILLNNCVVIFEELLEDENKIVVKCSDGSYTMPLSFVHTLTSAQNKKLHSMNYLSRATNHRNRKKLNRKQFFGLSGFVSKSNYTVLVSRNNESDFFISNYHIEDVQVRQLFPWGKIKKTGEVEVLGPHSKSDKPNCLISPDLDRLYTFLVKARQKPDLIIFDGFYHYINQLYLFDDILQFNIPVIVIAEESELPTLGHLYDRDFREFRIRNHPEFEFRIELNEAYFPELTDAYRAIKNIKKKHHEHSSYISELLDSLSILTYQISRSLSMSPDFLQTKSEKINQIKAELERNGMWIPDELKQELLQIIEKLNLIEITTENASKLKALIDLAIREDQVKKIIVVRTQSDARYYNLLFEYLELKKLKAVTMQELLTRNEKIGKLIIYYWPGHNQIFKLLTSYAYQTLNFIFYPHEKEWLKNRLKQWHNEYGLEFNYSDSNDSESHGMIHQDVSEDDDTDFENLEIRIITRRYQLSPKSDDSTESICKSKLVIFNGSHYSFFTDQQRLMVVTDLIYENGEEIERRTVSELQNGDIVLFRDSDNDLIREIADAILQQNQKLHLRKTASIWREALLRRYEALDESIRRLKRELKASGCNRHEITIRNWLFDDSMIGPRDMNDIVLISRATMDKELNENLQQVLDAVSTLRGVHLQAASYLNRQLISKLPDMMGNVNKSLSQVVTLKLDQYGTITLASVDRVSDEYTEVSLSATYKLFPLE
jgi:hypothetical protein